MFITKMKVFNWFKCSAILLCALSLLSACGGSTNDSPSPQPVANQAPSVSVNDITIDEGNNVSLTATVSDADGSIAGYAWSQTSGTSVALSGSDSNMASFVAPQGNADQTLVFNLQVTDDDGASTSVTLTVTVQDIDTAGTMVSSNQGGTVTSDDGKVILSIPAGALSSDTNISIRARPASDIPNAHIPEDMAVTSHYQFSPEGLVFAQAVRVTMPFDLIDETTGDMPLTWLVSGRGEGDDSEYEVMQNVNVNRPERSISADMMHFSSVIFLHELVNLFHFSIEDSTGGDTSDYVNGNDRFSLNYELTFDSKDVASANETRSFLAVNSVSWGQNIYLLPNLSLDELTHDKVAEVIVYDNLANNVQISSDGEISGQCKKVDPKAIVQVGAGFVVEYTQASQETSIPSKMGKILVEETQYRISLADYLYVNCLPEKVVVVPTDPFLISLDTWLTAVEGMVILNTISLVQDAIVSAVCPQILVAGAGGTVLVDACKGEVLRSFVGEENTDNANYQTAVLVAPEGEDAQINMVQNQLLLGFDLTTLELYDFAMLLDFSFSNPQPFIDMTYLGGDNSKGLAFVAGNSYLGILKYNFEFKGYESIRYILQDNAKSVVASADGSQALIVNSKNQLVFYELSGDQPVRTLVSELGDDIRRLRCDYLTNICVVADFVLNQIKTFIWNGLVAPTGIVATQSVADGPVEMAIQGDLMAVAGYRDDKLSVLTLDAQGEVSANTSIDLPTGCQGVGHVEIIEGAFILSCYLSGNLLYLPMQP